MYMYMYIYFYLAEVYIFLPGGRRVGLVEERVGERLRFSLSLPLSLFFHSL